MNCLAVTVVSLSTVLSLWLFTAMFIQAHRAQAASEAGSLPSGSSADAPSLTITRIGSPWVLPLGRSQAELSGRRRLWPAH
ncbi:hypothetical protein ABMY26_34255 [Azospirillum sp. HJ39]|uniref:hypothetical protein n=1 Tax=Azospirillum sp. HJ39 TaxID=3159496 RepID=UPI003557E0EB